MSNELGREKSPYLKQHAHNPVHWRPWGPAALEAAKRENKVIFLSIGYSTCHWCHVMEKESFEKQEVADLLNAHFIAIKVDREERPDVDALYMDAVQAMTGRGGWPLSAFLTPDRRAFFGGTYFPRPAFMQILAQIAQVWREQPDKAHSAAESLSVWLREHEKDSLGQIPPPELSAFFVQQAERVFDPVYGGKTGAPKFPPSHEMRAWMREVKMLPPLLTTSLTQMNRGGIYDHLGGGFHRYSTDEEWLVPHFEKMLYDQAALTQLYLEAWQITQDAEYALVVRETLDYVLRDLRDPRGAFYAAEDADSEGIEGTFYVWTLEELQTTLDPEAYAAVLQAYGPTVAGNFEGKNILHLQTGYTRASRDPILQRALTQLKTVRDARVRPHRDEKILCGWNGLMIAAFARAGLALGEARYIAAARVAADTLLRIHTQEDGTLWRVSLDENPGTAGLVEDYAYFIHALIEVYGATREITYLEHAIRLQKIQDRDFLDPLDGAYFFSRPDDPWLVARQKEFHDGVVPSANAITALNLLRLAHYTQDAEMRQQAERLLAAVPADFTQIPMAYPQWLMAIDFARHARELVVACEASALTPAILQTLHREFAPTVLWAYTNATGQSGPALARGKSSLDQPLTFYWCEHGRCLAPTTNWQEIQERLVHE